MIYTIIDRGIQKGAGRNSKTGMYRDFWSPCNFQANWKHWKSCEFVSCKIQMTWMLTAAMRTYARSYTGILYTDQWRRSRRLTKKVRLGILWPNCLLTSCGVTLHCIVINGVCQWQPSYCCRLHAWWLLNLMMIGLRTAVPWLPLYKFSCRTSEKWVQVDIRTMNILTSA